MILENVKIFQNGRILPEGSLFIENGRFSDTAGEDSERIDCSGALAVPGFIDIHFHGCMGADFCDGTLSSIQKIADYEAANGITTICPATMSLSEEALLTIMRAAKTFCEQERSGARLAGINLEGPFLNPEKKGAQNVSYITDCNIDMFRRLNEASGGLIKLVDIAPETQNAFAFIDALKDEVRISLAHTNADYETAKAAIQRGAKHITHLYNAMPPFHHRTPGVIGAAFEDEECVAELICDGLHVHAAAIKAAFLLFSPKRIILISDSMSATGMGDGTYQLGGQEVFVRDGRAVLADGSLAGSVKNLFDCFRIAVREIGLPLEEVLPCVSEHPAKEIGIFDETGSIETGKLADLLLLKEDLELVSVIRDGRFCFTNGYRRREK